MSNNQHIVSDKDRSLPWKLIPRTIFALLGAAITPAIIILVLTVMSNLFSVTFKVGSLIQDSNWATVFGITLIVLIVSVLHVIILGIPAFILGWYFKVIRWWSSLIGAFFIGAIPTAILFWPLQYPELKTTSSRWDGEKMVQTMIDGVPTVTGWIDYISAFTIMGLFGVGGGLVFWLIWSTRKQPNSSQIDP